MEYKKIKLKNGLRVILAPVSGTQTVAVSLIIGVGSRYETEKEAGLSHFIEHMLFKGTKKRPNALLISEELDAIGGEYNAFTAKDKTGYYAKVDAKHLDIAFDVISDIFLNSLISEKEIAKEKGAIIQELNMYEDTPMQNVGNVFENLLYQKNPLGREIVGNKKTLTAMRRKDFIDYMKRFYVANDTVLCVAGRFDEIEVIKKTREMFGKMASGKKASFLEVTENQEKPAVSVKFKKTDQTHMIVGTRAYDFFHKDRFALDILAVILGGNMSSRLFIEVREKRGLAYYVKTTVENFADCGYIATQAGVEHKNTNLALATILSEYKKISRKKVGPKELQKAKDYVKGRIIMNLESSDEVAMFYAGQEVSRSRILMPAEIFKKIDEVSESDIMRVASDVFQNRKLNLAVIGPHKEKTIIKMLNL